MKTILLSIKPKWVTKILNGEKTIEVRKRFPKDYKGWVYIYCTKDETFAHFLDGVQINGRVVARFYCDKVEDFGRKYAFAYKDNHFYEILEKACMDTEELGKYYQPKRSDWENGKVHLYAIHISQLEIFDKPKELSEFYKVGYLRECYNLESHFADIEGCDGGINESYVEECYEKLDKEYQLTKAPQSYMFIEVEE